MKILVPQKQVADPGIIVSGSRFDVNTSGTNTVVNPFCAIALEAAVRLKECGLAAEVIVVSIGTRAAQKFLTKSLACGADRALLVEVDSEEDLIPLDIAYALQQVVAVEKPDLVLMGKQAVDFDNNQVGQMLSALLDWPLITAASKIAVENRQLTVEHEVDDGMHIHTFLLPGVVTVDLQLNEPRSPGLAAVVKARSKSIDIFHCPDFPTAKQQHLEVIDTYAPHRDINIKMLDDVKGLADAIKTHSYRLG